MTKEEFFEKNKEKFEHYEAFSQYLLCTSIERCNDCYYNKRNMPGSCDDLKKDWPIFKRKMKLKKLLS